MIENYLEKFPEVELEIISEEEKEDLGVLFLMQQVDRKDTVSRKEVMKALEE